MKQVAQNYRSGELAVLDVPAPACRPGGVLVRSLFSLISTGTEMMKVTEAKLSLVGKARARPDQVRKVLDTVAQQGAVATYKKVMNRLDSYTPLGYSLCGMVVEVGARGRGVPGRPAGRRGRQRVRPARRGTTGCPANLCVAGPAGRRCPSTPPSRPSARSPCTAYGGPRSSSATRPAYRAGPGRSAGGPAARRVRGPRRRARRDRGPLPAGGEGWRGRCAPHRPTRARRQSSGARRDHRRPRCRPCLPRRRRCRTGPVEARRPAGPGPGPRRRHRQDAPGLAVERLLRQGTRRPLLPVVRPGRYDDRYELDGIDYPAGYVRWTERRNLECFLDLHRARGDRGRLAHLRCLPDRPGSRRLRRSRVRLARRAVGVLLRVSRAGGRDHAAASTSRVVSTTGRARRAQPGPAAAARRVHRRRELRDVDAAAAPGPAR